MLTIHYNKEEGSFHIHNLLCLLSVNPTALYIRVRSEQLTHWPCHMSPQLLNNTTTKHKPAFKLLETCCDTMTAQGNYYDGELCLL